MPWLSTRDRDAHAALVGALVGITGTLFVLDWRTGVLSVVVMWLSAAAAIAGASFTRAR